MNSLKHTYPKPGQKVSFLLTLLLSLLFVGLSAAQGEQSSKHDFSTHHEGAEITQEISISAVHCDYWYESYQLFHKNRSFHPNSQKSIPPVNLRLNNEPAGEDERKLLPDLIAPLATSIPKATRQRSLQPIPLGFPLVRDFALQFLSTVILLN